MLVGVSSPFDRADPFKIPRMTEAALDQAFVGRALRRHRVAVLRLARGQRQRDEEERNTHHETLA